MAGTCGSDLGPEWAFAGKRAPTVRLREAGRARAGAQSFAAMAPIHTARPRLAPILPPDAP
jgi:hypothetical protein